jgi:hypothetical protein
MHSSTYFIAGWCWLIRILIIPYFCSTSSHSTSITVAQSTDTMLLRQVHVIARHGARISSSTTTTTSGETSNFHNEVRDELTPYGEKQAYELGQWIQNRYYESTTGLFVRNRLNLDSNDADATHRMALHFETSAIHSTIVTANMMASGLFNPENATTSILPTGVTSTAPVPVVTYYPTTQDIVLAAQYNCPYFASFLQNELYNSDAWTGMLSSSMPLLRRLAQLPIFQSLIANPTASSEEEKYIALDRVWIIFDAMVVAKTECEVAMALAEFMNNVAVAECQELRSENNDPKLNEAIDLVSFLNANEWNELQSLAYSAEIVKYGTDHTDRLISSNLLLEILNRMNAADPNYDSMYIYTAEYPTLLALLSILNGPSGLAFDAQSTLKTAAIPNHAAAILLELFQDTTTGSMYVQVSYKEGNDGLVDSTTVSDRNDMMITFDLLNVRPQHMSLSNICSGVQGMNCPLSTLNDYVVNSRHISTEQWCSLCNNHEAASCLQDIVQNDCSSSQFNNPLGAGFGFGMLFAILLAVVGAYIIPHLLRRQTRSKKASSYSDSIPPSFNLNSRSSYVDDDDNQNNNFSNPPKVTTSLPTSNTTTTTFKGMSVVELS